MKTKILQNILYSVNSILTFITINDCENQILHNARLNPKYQWTKKTEWHKTRALQSSRAKVKYQEPHISLEFSKKKKNILIIM